MKKKDAVHSIAFRGTKGALIGILVGLILGLIIWGFLLGVDEIFSVESSYTVMPASVCTFLGMGFGAILGGIFGSIACLKENLRHNK